MCLLNWLQFSIQSLSSPAEMMRSCLVLVLLYCCYTISSLLQLDQRNHINIHFKADSIKYNKLFWIFRLIAIICSKLFGLLLANVIKSRSFIASGLQLNPIIKKSLCTAAIGNCLLSGKQMREWSCQVK